MKGATSLVLAGILVVVIIAAVGYFGAMSGFFTQGAQDAADSASPNGSGRAVTLGQGNTGSDSSPTGLVTGTPVITGSGGRADQASQPENVPEAPPEIDAPSGPATGAASQSSARAGTGGSGSSGGSSSGGGGGSGKGSCTPEWHYSAWSACSPEGISTRTVTDYRCSTASKTEGRSCDYVPPEPGTGCQGLCVVPAGLEVNLENETFEISVVINTNEEVFASSLNIIYDNDLITIADIERDITEGGFLRQDNEKIVSFPSINIEDNGSLANMTFATTRYDTGTGVSGEGSLLTITFTIVDEGSGEILIDNVLITDSSINPVIVDKDKIRGATIKIE